MLAEDYISRLKQLSFNVLPQGCKADYILFKRGLGGAVDGKNVAANFFAISKQLHQWKSKSAAEKNITVSNSRRASIII